MNRVLPSTHRPFRNALVPVAAAALLVATPRLLAPYSRALRVHQLRAQRQIARLAEKSGNNDIIAMVKEAKPTVTKAAKAKTKSKAEAKVKGMAKAKAKR